MKHRQADDIQTVGDFLSLFKRGEKGSFLCTNCGKDHTDLIKKLPDDGHNRSFVCGGCLRRIRVNGGQLSFQVFMKHHLGEAKQ